MVTCDELLKRIDTTRIYPPLLFNVRAMLDALIAQNLHFWAASTGGWRSENDQMVIWMQGRLRPGKIATHARPLESPHNFGLAVDFIADEDPRKSGLQPTWKDDRYLPLGAAAKARGLIWGGDFVGLSDKPHVQVPLFISRLDLVSLGVCWRNNVRRDEPSRLRACWDLVDVILESRGRKLNNGT